MEFSSIKFSGKFLFLVISTAWQSRLDRSLLPLILLEPKSQSFHRWIVQVRLVCSTTPSNTHCNCLQIHIYNMNVQSHRIEAVTFQFLDGWCLQLVLQLVILFLGLGSLSQLNWGQVRCRPKCTCCVSQCCGIFIKGVPGFSKTWAFLKKFWGFLKTFCTIFSTTTMMCFAECNIDQYFSGGTVEVFNYF